MFKPERICHTNSGLNRKSGMSEEIPDIKKYLKYKSSLDFSTEWHFFKIYSKVLMSMNCQNSGDKGLNTHKKFYTTKKRLNNLIKSN